MSDFQVLIATLTALCRIFRFQAGLAFFKKNFLFWFLGCSPIGLTFCVSDLSAVCGTWAAGKHKQKCMYGQHPAPRNIATPTFCGVAILRGSGCWPFSITFPVFDFDTSLICSFIVLTYYHS